MSFPAVLFICAFFLSVVFAVVPADAWAFVPHDYPEIYLHQMGHAYFIISCVFILLAILKNRLQREKGWRYLALTQVFFILWNVDTFIGHITEYWVDPSQITGSREGIGYFMREISLHGRQYLFYITKFDNLILVAAVLIFYLGLREQLEEEEKTASPVMAVLPLLPVMFSDIAGAAVIIALSVMSLATAVKLYRKNEENTLWHYMLWLSTSYVAFSLSRSLGHILNRFLTVAGRHDLWRWIEPISGSFNTFTFILIGSLNLFFFRVYQSYLRMSEYNRKIESINTDLSELNQELETLVAERTMSLMALTVADKVRNPAAVIGWTCKRILEKEEVTDRLGENLKDVIDESEKLEGIVKDFEVLLKSKRSMFKYEDINEILRGVAALVEKEAAEKRVRVIMELSERPLNMNMQKNLLRAAFFYVIRNALEATKGGGAVTIASAGEGDKVIVAVSDTGAGIAKEDLGRIFDPFFSTKRFRFGIGLPLVRQIISEHLGEIKVESEVGKGTVFRMIFPARWTERK
ncbi:MAG TPA: HAMP domain-containing sensor histidine kinase [Dissulfurispiraceae bacterium]